MTRESEPANGVCQFSRSPSILTNWAMIRLGFYRLSIDFCFDCINTVIVSTLDFKNYDVDTATRG